MKSRHLLNDKDGTLTDQRQLDLLGVLLEAGADPNLPNCEPALLMAISSGDNADEAAALRRLELLLDFGANPNSVGRRPPTYRFPPLHCATRGKEWPEVTKLLLSRGADPKAIDGHGLTPLESLKNLLSDIEKTYKKSIARVLPDRVELGGLGSVVGKIKNEQEGKDRLKLRRFSALIALLESAESQAAR